MRRFKRKSISLAIGIILVVSLSRCGDATVGGGIGVDRTPHIRPDYSDVVIPPNIAPMNFMIEEPGEAYLVQIHAKEGSGSPIRICSTKNKVIIPTSKWKKLLTANPGKELCFEISVQDSLGRWKKFLPVVNQIAEEPIDSHVAYRLINPGYVLWFRMGIYQRDLENFDEDAIFTNRATQRNCMNCHSFCLNNPDKMMFHMRADFGGTMLINEGAVQKVDTKTDYTMSAGVYPSWHPDGKHIAFSTNIIYQNFHAQKDKSIFVWDKASDLIVYDIPSQTVTTSPKVATKREENMPAFSPDGKYLYFCSAPEWQENQDYKDFKYDLMRIAYDAETNAWGEVETVLSSAQTGKSISFPRVSPDGRYLLFTMSDFGYFSIHFTSSDLYLLDLKTNQYRKLDVNSESSESFHSWSHNSRWFVFASKREDGVLSRLYFSHLDSLGNASKPFLMPQKDPTFYDTFVLNYNVPEMIDGPVRASHWTLMNAARKAPVKAQFDSTVPVDALSGASRMKGEAKK